jgi:isoquinoline 1-oxidoreductase subunit beta
MRSGGLNFDNYQMLRIDEAPSVEIHIVQSPEPPGVSPAA